MPDVESLPNSRQRSKHPGLLVLWMVLAVGYLAASASGLSMVATVVVGLMVGALLAASGRLFAGSVASATLLGVCFYFSDSLQFIIYAPPLAAFAFMAWFFYRTLRPGSEQLITRVARKEHPDLTPDMVRYTRRFTWAWAYCFMLLFATALSLAPLLPLDAWARWVHGLGYVLPGALFLGEYVYRHHRFRDRQHGSLLVLIPNIVSVSKEAALSPGQGDAESGRRR